VQTGRPESRSLASGGVAPIDIRELVGELGGSTSYANCSSRSRPLHGQDWRDDINGELLIIQISTRGKHMHQLITIASLVNIF
jgi:hypothetical protein